MADLSYYVEKNGINEVVDICLQLQKNKPDAQALAKIEKSLMSLSENGVNELLKHPKLFDFPPVAAVLFAQLSNEKKIAIIQQAAANPGTIPDRFVLQRAAQYYQTQKNLKENGDMGKALSNLQMLHQLLGQFNNKEIITLKNEVQRTIVQYNNESQAIEIIQKNTSDKTNIIHFIEQFNSFLKGQLRDTHNKNKDN